jgi:hypothetical protein
MNPSLASPQRHPHTPSPSRASLIGRQRAGQLAIADTGQALEAARGCPDAWYRVQALASVAELAEAHLVPRILDEAAREAQSCHDACGTVAVMAWPLGVAYRRAQTGFAERELMRCLALAADVEPLASRAYALELIWTRCFAIEPRLAIPVWRRVLELCHPDHSWRAARLYLHVAQSQEQRNPGAAAAVIQAMRPGKARSRLERRFGIA